LVVLKLRKWSAASNVDGLLPGVQSPAVRITRSGLTRFGVQVVRMFATQVWPQ
jgi:hypothetical protein